MTRAVAVAFSSLVLVGAAAPQAVDVPPFGRDLWTVRPDGTHWRQLTDDPDPDFQPVVSPNGGRIAWSHGNVPQIWVMRSDGTGKRQLTTMPEGAFDPQWSPGGRRLAFMSWNSTQCHPGEKWCAFTEVWVADADGSDLRLAGPGIHPRWSPDGKRLVFYAFEPNIESDGLKLATLSEGGVSVRQLVSGLDAGGLSSPPAWGRSGWIAFSSARGVDLVRANGARRHIGRGVQPAWSPGGRRLAMVRRSGIWITDRLGRHGRRITRGGLLAVWSPRGTRFAYQDGDQIFVVSAEGGSARAMPPWLAVTLCCDYEYGPSPPGWSHDGRALIFSSSGPPG